MRKEMRASPGKRWCALCALRWIGRSIGQSIGRSDEHVPLSTTCRARRSDKNIDPGTRKIWTLIS